MDKVKDKLVKCDACSTEYQIGEGLKEIPAVGARAQVLVCPSCKAKEVITYISPLSEELKAIIAKLERLEGKELKRIYNKEVKKARKLGKPIDNRLIVEKQRKRVYNTTEAKLRAQDDLLDEIQYLAGLNNDVSLLFKIGQIRGRRTHHRDLQAKADSLKVEPTTKKR